MFLGSFRKKYELLKDAASIENSIDSINDDLQPSYTDKGRLVGYKNVGIEMLQEAVSEINNFLETNQN